MNKLKTALIITAVAALTLAACGKSNKVGNEGLLDVKQAEEGCRLGEICDTPGPSPTAPAGALALGAPSPSPSPSPVQQVQHYDVSLTSTEGSWYYDEMRKEEVTCLSVPVGTILRVTNKDTEPNRPFRTFTASNRDFSSPRLSVGQQWVQKFDRGGEWQVESEGAPFIILAFKVGVPCSG